MITLANHYGCGPVSQSTIVEEQSLSKKYVHQLITTLKKADLIESVRGKDGGLLLAKSPSKINLFDILSPLEGPFELTECVGDKKVCKRSSDCITIHLWSEASEILQKYFRSITLKSFISRYEKK